MLLTIAGFCPTIEPAVNRRRVSLMFRILTPMLLGLSLLAPIGNAQTCTNATFHGTYYALLRGTVNGLAYTELDKTVADGNGGLVVSETINNNAVISPGGYSGTYSLNADCSGTETPA